MELFKLYGTIGINNSEATNKIKETTTQAQKAAQNISKGFKSVGDVFKGIGTTFSKIGTTLSTVVTAPVVGLGVATAKTALSFLSLKEGANTAFKVLLGSGEAAQKMLDDLYTFAKTTPFSYGTYLVAGKTLVAMGVAAEDCIPYLDGITNAAIATGTGQEGVNSLAQALGRMQSSGKVTLETLNVLTYSGIPAIKILANEYGVTTEEMYKMISNSEILADEALPKLIQGMNEGTDGAAGATAAYGGLAKEMKGNLSGALDSLRSKFRNMSIDIWNAEEAYPELIKVIQDFTSSLDVLPKIFESVSKAAVPVLQTISDKLKQLKEYLDGLSPEQLQQIGNIILGLAAAGPILMVVGKAFSVIGSSLSSVGSIILNVSKAVGFLSGKLSIVTTACGGLAPFLGIVAAAIAAVIGVVIVLKDNWDKVVQTFQNFIANTGLAEKFNQIKEAIAPLWEKLQGLKDLFVVIGTTVIAVLQPAIAVIAGAFNGIVSAISPLMTAIGGLIDILAGLGTFIVAVFTGDMNAAWEAIQKIGQGILDVFGGLWDSVCGLLQGFVDGVIQWFTSLWDTLVGHSIVPDMINAIINWFKELLNKPIQFVIDMKDKVVNFFNQLKTTASNIFEAIKNKIVQIWENIKNTTINVWDNIKSAVSNVINTVKSVISNVFNTIKTVVTNVWNSIKSTTSNVWNGVKSAVSNVVNGIKSTVSSAFNSVKSTVSTIWNSIKSAIEKPINKARDIVKNAIDKMKGFFNFSWSLPKLKLPHFNISGKFSLNPPSVPSFGISWYKKALDDAYLLNSATIFGMNPNGTLLGGGEAGSEAIVGTDLLNNMIQTATNNGNSYLAEKLDKILMYLQEVIPELSNRQLVLDTGAIAGALTPTINKNLGTISASIARSRSY